MDFTKGKNWKQPFKGKRRSKKSVSQEEVSLSPSYEFLEEIRQRDPLNKACADCSGENPEWCSINLGVVICIECSGVHRSLGTHISKVRSLTLDLFTPQVSQLILLIGNQNANNIWEASKPENKPEWNTDKETRHQFIYAKYVQKRFMKPSEGAPSMQLLEALESKNVLKALEAIAHGADVNDPYPVDMLPNPVSLVPSSNVFLRLPVLDVQGNPYPDKVIDISIPSRSAPKTKKEYYVIRYPIHLALYHHDFTMAELLFQYGSDTHKLDEVTGCSLADLIGYGHHVLQDDIFEYLNNKNRSKGQALISKLNHIPSK